MDISYLILSIALIAAAAIVAYALLRRPAPLPVVEAPRDPRLDTVISQQGGLTERFHQTMEAQTLLQNTLTDRIDALNARLNENLQSQTEKTSETLGKIGERLSVIDEAQKNIAALSGQVVSLQGILSDKQTRGAFGQERMESIIADQLAPNQYDFQFTLSNGKRPDCVIRLPNVEGVVVVDAKFPLEAYEAFRSASDDAEKKIASARLRTDVQKHVKDIVERYLIPGEVQNPAIMFVPSESIYAELHSSFAELVQQARRQQVVIMSPHVLMLAISTIQMLMRNARMREQAFEIQKEVGALLLDVKRLGERIGDLRKHFDTTSKDIGFIETSVRGIERHADRIGQAKLGPSDDAEPSRLPGI